MRNILHVGIVCGLVFAMGLVATHLQAAEPGNLESWRKRVEPAEVRQVQGELLKLSPDAPWRWARGTPLRMLQTLEPGRGVPANGAIEAASVVVRHNDRTMAKDKDYVADPVWGSLGIGPSSSVTTSDEVTVDYRYSLRRIDSLVRDKSGKTTLRKGVSHLTAPQPPELQDGETRLANFFVDYFQPAGEAEAFPVLESAQQATTLTTPGRIPHTLEKIKSGKPVKIVCWGDSVTVGGDASTPDKRYADVFARRLKEKFPSADVTVEVVAVGGSNSMQWLHPDKHPFPGNPNPCNWQHVVDAKPDLVTLEFVNDAGFPPQLFDSAYAEILQRVEALGAELILITPHFTMPEMMGFKTLKEPESRPYVLSLRRLSSERNLALADASSRWAHLWKEGLPYPTLLLNGINHPDDRGHELFADELIKCFETQ